MIYFNMIKYILQAQNEFYPQKILDKIEIFNILIHRKYTPHVKLIGELIMKEKKIIILDFNGCKTYRDIHARIHETFGFPDWYGRNWSAFWDLLSTECDADEVIVKGESSMPAEYKDVFDIMHEILERNKTRHAERMKVLDWMKPFEYTIVD